MRFRTRLLVALCATPLSTLAQPMDSDSPDSETRGKAAPAYKSAFNNYRGLTDEKVDWKQANDNVGRIGGWRTYLRESQRVDSPADKSTQSQPAAPATPPVTKPSVPAAGSHGGHKY
jgi:hypothetical protein